MRLTSGNPGCPKTINTTPGILRGHCWLGPLIRNLKSVTIIGIYSTCDGFPDIVSIVIVMVSHSIYIVIVMVSPI